MALISREFVSGCGDITTRANIQLRGITLAEADKVFKGLQTVGLSSVSTGQLPLRSKPYRLSCNFGD